MKKFDKKYLHTGIMIVVSLCICIVFYHMITNGAKGFISVKDKFISIMLPIIDGFVIAYLMNPVMIFIEESILKPLFKKWKKYQDTKKMQAVIRGISVFFTMIIFVLIISGLITLIVPQLVNNIESIIMKMPSYLNSMNRWISTSLSSNPDIEELFETYSEEVGDFVSTKIIPAINSMISSISSDIISRLYDVLKGTFKFIVGTIISIYLLYRKDIHIAQLKKILYAYMKKEAADDFISNARFVNNTFGGFLSGKILDSIIIGIICFIIMSIMKLPYAVLISFIIGVTNVIPYFGPFIGAIPSGFIILLINPKQCLIFLIMILILQQFDGNVLGPKILGGSTGLSSFWVIFSITLFGGLLGPVGMFIGVPVFAVIYSAYKAYIENRLEKKGMPVATEDYMEAEVHQSIHFIKKKDAANGEDVVPEERPHFILSEKYTKGLKQKLEKVDKAKDQDKDSDDKDSDDKDSNAKDS
ncbi:MAG: AI-2E family transporter [Lachnospiraceae bacterium]|nr:AI-2E family transporter [Lachnospiraceae bacterium]